MKKTELYRSLALAACIGSRQLVNGSNLPPLSSCLTTTWGRDKYVENSGGSPRFFLLYPLYFWLRTLTPNLWTYRIQN